MTPDPRIVLSAMTDGLSVRAAEVLFMPQRGAAAVGGTDGLPLGAAAACGLVLGGVLALCGGVMCGRTPRVQVGWSSARSLGVALVGSSLALLIGAPYLANLTPAAQWSMLAVPSGVLGLAIVVAVFLTDWRPERGDRCAGCGHGLLAEQQACPECGAVRALDAARRDRARATLVTVLAGATTGAFLAIAVVRLMAPAWSANIHASVAVAKFGRFLEVDLRTRLDRTHDGQSRGGVVPRGPLYGSARLLGATNRVLPVVYLNGSTRDLEIGDARGFDASIDEFRRLATIGTNGLPRPEPGTATTAALVALLEGLERRTATGRREPWAPPIEQISWTARWGHPPAVVHWTQLICALTAATIALIAARARPVTSAP